MKLAWGKRKPGYWSKTRSKTCTQTTSVAVMREIFYNKRKCRVEANLRSLIIEKNEDRLSYLNFVVVVNLQGTPCGLDKQDKIIVLVVLLFAADWRVRYHQLLVILTASFLVFSVGTCTSRRNNGFLTYAARSARCE